MRRAAKITGLQPGDTVRLSWTLQGWPHVTDVMGALGDTKVVALVGRAGEQAGRRARETIAPACSGARLPGRTYLAN